MARHADGIDDVAGDVRDADSVRRAVDGVEAVVSTVTGFGLGRPGPRAIDFAGNVNLIRASEAAGVSRFVLVSVVGAAPNHGMELMRMKHAAEQALKTSTLDWRIVRPTTFLDLWTEIIWEPIKRGGTTVVFGRGDNPINFVPVADVARALADALADSAPSRSAIEVGGPRNITLNQLVQEIANDSLRRPKVRRIPVPVMRLSRAVLQPFRPDIAGMIEAGIAMATTDMTFDATTDRRLRLAEV